tara:strand:+ start:3572 stop:3742 length:171 start_codon:yes stop_codon:yes gene_type:complete
MIKEWILNKIKEKTSWNGAVLIILGVVVLIAGPLAKLAAYAAIFYGIYCIWQKEDD